MDPRLTPPVQPPIQPPEYNGLPEQPAVTPLAAQPGPQAYNPTPPAGAWLSNDEYAAQLQNRGPVVQPRRGVSGLLVAAVTICSLLTILGLINVLAWGQSTDFAPVQVILVAVPLTVFVFGLVALIRDAREARTNGIQKSHKARNITIFILAIVALAIPLAIIAVVILFIALLANSGV